VADDTELTQIPRWFCEGRSWEAVLARCRAGTGWIVDGVLRRGFERGFAAEFASRKMGWMDVRAEARILQRLDEDDAAGLGCPAN